MIVIPMVGRSRRFFEAGYTMPKYRLPLGGKSVFALSVGSFKQVAEREEVLIVCLREDNAADFARRELDHLEIARSRVVELPCMTAGQADTVSQGISASGASAEESVLIFNIDTFRPGFDYPRTFASEGIDGYLECFIGSGPNWSNAVPAGPGSNRVVRTSEKRQESEYCCTGLYYFRRAGDFDRAYQAELAVHARGLAQTNELYVAPIYNHLIAEGADIRVDVVSPQQVIFCGVPSEYQSLLQSPPLELQQYLANLAA